MLVPRLVFREHGLPFRLHQLRVRTIRTFEVHSVHRLHAERDTYLVVTVRQANPLRLGHEDGHRVPTAKGRQAPVVPLATPFYESTANTPAMRVRPIAYPRTSRDTNLSALHCGEYGRVRRAACVDSSRFCNTLFF